MTKEEAIERCRKMAQQKFSYISVMISESQREVTFAIYSKSTITDRDVMNAGRGFKKSYLFSKGRVNEVRHLETSRNVERTRVPGPHNIEVATVRFTLAKG